MLCTARIHALIVDTSALLFVCGPTTGSLMLSYSACGKKTPNPACPYISDPVQQKIRHGFVIRQASQKVLYWLLSTLIF